MPRKAFIADLQKAVEGVAITGISDVQPGGDDGEFTFRLTNAANGSTLKLSALVPDVSEYPSSHACMIFAPDDAPSNVAAALGDLSDSATGKSIVQLLELVARKLRSTDGDGDTQMLDSQADYDSGGEDGDDFDDDESVEEYFPDDEIVPKPIFGKTETTTPEGYTRPTSTFRHRIRSDLLAAKAEGFKVGHLGGLMDGLGCYVSLSCRMSKLGISEEAMQAWQIEPTEYLIIIFHYPNGYKHLDSLRSYDAQTARRQISMRIGISHTYKPTMQEAIRAFTTLSREEEKRGEGSQTESVDNRGFRNAFISRPINELLNERLVTLIEYRYMGMPWSGAETYYSDHYGTNIENSDTMNDKYMEPEMTDRAFPPLITADHISQASIDETHSFPVIGMQFVLRHFVRCTEFCLVCFAKMPEDLQAIKPYVCDKPLCLYQYMSLGFGPSIEHEILAQPKVVDLLISFCYITARTANLKEYPTGLSLMVPPASAFENEYMPAPSYYGQPAPAAPPSPASLANPAPEPGKMRFNEAEMEMIFDDASQKCPVRTGDWVLIRVGQNAMRTVHCRIVETTYYPTIKVSQPLTAATAFLEQNTYPPGLKPPIKPQTPSSAGVNQFVPSTFFVYNQNFDDLNEHCKRTSIACLLDLLPSVADMQSYLAKKTQSGLSSWVDRLSPAVVGILRWIIASNRACIVQVEDLEGTESKGRKGEERLYGMGGWMQFRFAMGAPDKERRFIQSVRTTSDRLKLKYATLFAWHGSPLHNWHSIIRSGLHYRDTAHGRAYGHGVYHSLDVNTSMSYCGYGATSNYWPASELKVSSALALNEIVNAPKEFVSSSPHLVVAQLDWIQTRYLFVRGNTTQATGPLPKENKPLQTIEQDPGMTPRGSTDKLIIPVHALGASRRPQKLTTNKAPNKRQKASGKSLYEAIDLDAEISDDGASVATLEEDLAIFTDEDAPAPQPEVGPITTGKGKEKATGGFFSKLIGSKNSKSSKPMTDFVPGTLDHSTLPMLEPPVWATISATKRLQQDFKTLLKVQETEPLHELGWYIDPNLITNMYQWIVELHSFDPTLPLAKDMKAKGFKSVVLELRFGKDYPMSPPFVRVIRPRFLGFQQGGGGHVTAGGAMCMELLTNDGWSAVSSIESILLQVRMAMSSLDPKPARLENGPRADYGIAEAVDAYMRACAVHGWTVPPGFKELAYGASSGAPY